ncbi:hypothetical protein MNBD_GAMMA13-1119, partial [hydrothermal vent metagenome]
MNSALQRHCVLIEYNHTDAYVHPRYYRLRNDQCLCTGCGSGRPAVCPAVAVLVIGMFWRRANADAAFAALITGLLGGALLFVANVVL